MSMASASAGARLETRDQEVLPAARAAEPEPGQLRPPVVQMAVELPGEPHAGGRLCTGGGVARRRARPPGPAPARFRPPVVQMAVELPGEPHAAVRLDV